MRMVRIILKLLSNVYRYNIQWLISCRSASSETTSEKRASTGRCRHPNSMICQALYSTGNKRTITDYNSSLRSDDRRFVLIYVDKTCEKNGASRRPNKFPHNFPVGNIYPFRVIQVPENGSDMITLTWFENKSVVYTCCPLLMISCLHSKVLLFWVALWLLLRN